MLRGSRNHCIEERRMKFNVRGTSHRFLVGGAVLLWPLLAAAAAPPGPGTGCGPDFHGGPAGGPPPHRSGPEGPGEPPGPPGMPGGMPDELRPPPFLMGLTLSEEQQDKVFAILHAAAPALRDQSKAARKARQALHDLVKSAQFNDATAASLAQAQGRAESQLTLLRTRAEHEVYAVLTPEQTARVSAREPEWEGRRGEGPHP
jgi:protein CpxP